MITVVFESQVDSEQGSKAWEQGLALLLSSSDIEPVQAIFMQGQKSLEALPLKLGKKLQQLELYEVASYSLEQAKSAIKDGESNQCSPQGDVPCGTMPSGDKVESCNGLDWSWVEGVSTEYLRELVEQDSLIFSV